MLEFELWYISPSPDKRNRPVFAVNVYVTFCPVAPYLPESSVISSSNIFILLFDIFCIDELILLIMVLTICGELALQSGVLQKLIFLHM